MERISQDMEVLEFRWCHYSRLFVAVALVSLVNAKVTWLADLLKSPFTSLVSNSKLLAGFQVNHFVIAVVHSHRNIGRMRGVNLNVNFIACFAFLRKADKI